MGMGQQAIIHPPSGETWQTFAHIRFFVSLVIRPALVFFFTIKQFLFFLQIRSDHARPGSGQVRSSKACLSGWLSGLLSAVRSQRPETNGVVFSWHPPARRRLPSVPRPMLSVVCCLFVACCVLRTYVGLLLPRLACLFARSVGLVGFKVTTITTDPDAYIGPSTGAGLSRGKCSNLE